MNDEGLVTARAKADPDYDLRHTSWLNQLHEESMPFTTKEVVLR